MSDIRVVHMNPIYNCIAQTINIIYIYNMDISIMDIHMYTVYIYTHVYSTYGF